MDLAVKLASDVDGSDVIEGLAMPFGGPFNGRDLAGEFFSAKTDFALDWFGPGERPLLYHHGLDTDAGISVVGRVSDYKATDTGVWSRAQLDKSGEYFDAIKELVAAGKLFFSSGSMNHLVERTKRGELTRWPWIELSLTPTPCNLLAETTLAETTKHFETAGIKSEGIDVLKATLDTAERKNLSGGEFAYIDSAGGKHLPINDVAHVRAAMARFNQTQFESPAKKKSAARKILNKAKSLGVDVSDDSAIASASKAFGLLARALMRPSLKALPTEATMVDGDGDDSSNAPEGSYEDLAGDLTQMLRGAFGGGMFDGPYVYVTATFPGYCVACVCEDGGKEFYEVAYDIGDDQEPILGEMRRVERRYIPVEMPDTEEAPLAMQAARLYEFADTVTRRAAGVNVRRIKEGRIISYANRTRLKETSVALEGALKALNELLDATEPQPAKAASVLSAQRELDLLEAWASVELADAHIGVAS